jgi:hypothetical protein
MDIKKLCAMIAASPALAFSGAAFSADHEKSDASADAKTEAAKKPAKKKVKPHSHARDEKGIPTSDKLASKSETGAASDGQQKMQPHSHMRDEKGMGMTASNALCFA